MRTFHSVLIVTWPRDWHPETVGDEPPMYRVVRVGYANLQQREAADACRLFNELQLTGERRLWAVAKRQSFTGR